jgi:hypothetical protein
MAIDGAEVITTANVQVLVNPGGANIHFNPATNGGLPEWGEAIVGGATANGEPLYTIRCLVRIIYKRV